MIFSFINSFPSSFEENKFENVSPANKTVRFLAFFNSVLSLFRSLRLFFFLICTSFLTFHFCIFRGSRTKPFPQLPMNMHYPVDCLGRFFQDVLQLFQFIVIELQFPGTVRRNSVFPSGQVDFQGEVFWSYLGGLGACFPGKL